MRRWQAGLVGSVVSGVVLVRAAGSGRVARLLAPGAGRVPGLRAARCAQVVVCWVWVSEGRHKLADERGAFGRVVLDYRREPVLDVASRAGRGGWSAIARAASRPSATGTAGPVPRADRCASIRVGAD